MKSRLPPKIVHLSTAHSAFDHRIFYKEARSAAKAGLAVTVIANHMRSGTYDDVEIIALPDRHSRLSRMLLAPWSVLRHAIAARGDIYQFHDPELIPVGLILKLLGRTVVYDIHEEVDKQILIKSWIPTWLRRPIAWSFAIFEQQSIRIFDGISVPQTYMRDRYQRAARRVALTRNFAEKQEDQLYPMSERSLVLHAGTLGKERGLLNMVRAMEYISDHRLVLVGPCRDRQTLEEAIRLPGWRRVSYEGPLPFRELEALYRQAAVGLILYENIGQYDIAIPVKLFEYMASGVPVVMPNYGHWPAINAELNCGISVDPGNARQVADAINMLFADREFAARLGNNGRKAFLERYSWDSEAKNLLTLYAELLRRNVGNR